MLKKLTTKGRKRLAQILSIILEGIILYVLILTWTKAGGLELKETWLKYTSIFAIIFASDGLSTLFTDKIYSLCGVEKERTNIEKELEELRIETEQNLNDKDENNKTKFSHKLLMITFVLCFLSIILIGLMFWIFLRVANLINGSG